MYCLHVGGCGLFVFFGEGWMRGYVIVGLWDCGFVDLWVFVCFVFEG